MADMILPPGEDCRYEAVQYIRAPLEEVWRALTDPAEVDLWHICQVRIFETVQGGRIELTRDGVPTIIGRITDFEPTTRLGYTFRFTHRNDEPETLVLLELSTTDTLCRVKVTHMGFPSVNKTYHDVAGCWPVMLSGIQDLLERRHPRTRSRAA